MALTRMGGWAACWEPVSIHPPHLHQLCALALETLVDTERKELVSPRNRVSAAGQASSDHKPVVQFVNGGDHKLGLSPRP